MKKPVRRGPNWLAASVKMTKVTDTTSEVIVIRPESRLDSSPRAVSASPLYSHHSVVPRGAMKAEPKVSIVKASTSASALISVGTIHSWPRSIAKILRRRIMLRRLPARPRARSAYRPAT